MIYAVVVKCVEIRDSCLFIKILNGFDRHLQDSRNLLQNLGFNHVVLLQPGHLLLRSGVAQLEGQRLLLDAEYLQENMKVTELYFLSIY